MIEIFTLILQCYVFDFMCGWYNIKIFVEKRVLFYYEKSKVYSKETRKVGLLNALYDVGITMNDVNPDYVVVGEGRSYSLDTLTKATNLVLKGAKLIGVN